MIRKVIFNDAEQVLDIYNYYVMHSIVTLDLVPFSRQDLEEKITSISSQYPFIFFEETNNILGYAYANTFRTKSAYKNTVELTVYVKHTALGKQIGKQLYSALLGLLKNKKSHVFISIFF